MVFAELASSHLQLLLGIGFGALILSFAFVFGGRFRNSAREIPSQPAPSSFQLYPFSNREMENRNFEAEIKEWDTILRSIQSEKRRSVRLKGFNLEVEIVVKESGNSFFGIVLDRSINGLRLAVEKVITPGTILKVRAVNLNPPMPWQEIKVARNKAVGRSGWEIGCEFVTTPTWNIMLQFG